jgi:branched-chain amino acid transport system substrate-binding protein
MRKILVISFTLFLITLPAHADITLGLVGPFTGNVALGGEQIKRGAEQAVADINAAGGINGEKLVLYPVDDACDPKQAVAAANKIASAGIKFVTGFYCSSAAIPASKVYMEEGVLMVVSSASNPKLTEEAKDTVLRVYPSDDKQGSFIAQTIIKDYHDKKIAIVNDQSAWGAGLAAIVKENLNHAGVKEVMFDAYTTGQRDYSSLVTKLKQIGADVVFMAGFPTEVGLILRQMKEQDTHIQVIGGDALTTDQFWEIAGSTGEGVLLSYTADPRKHPEAKTVVAALRKAGYEPEGVTLYTYGAVQVVAESIRRAGKSDVLKAAQALRHAPVNTVLGPLTFDGKGDVINPAFSMYRWHDGKYIEAIK